MTNAQKDAIVKAAMELVEAWRPIPKFPDRSMTALESILASAVRAAEQPRWTVQRGAISTNLLRDGEFVTGTMGVTKPSFIDRIARLLNEDDAKGGK